MKTKKEVVRMQELWDRLLNLEEKVLRLLEEYFNAEGDFTSITNEDEDMVMEEVIFQINDHLQVVGWIVVHKDKITFEGAYKIEFEDGTSEFGRVFYLEIDVDNEKVNGPFPL